MTADRFIRSLERLKCRGEQRCFVGRRDFAELVADLAPSVAWTYHTKHGDGIRVAYSIYDRALVFPRAKVRRDTVEIRC